MTARALKRPAPEAWQQLGFVLHQDIMVGMEMIETDLDVHLARVVLNYSNLTPHFAELKELLSELLAKAESSGDFTRAWRNLEHAQIWLPKPARFFESLLAELENV